MNGDVLERLRQNQAPLVVSGAGIVGAAVVERCRRHGIRVDGICDGSIKTAGTDFLGHTVVHTPKLAEHFPTDTRVLVTVAAIADVVRVLEAQGFDNWIAAGPWLATEAVDAATNTDALALAVDTCIACHAAFLHPERAFLRSVDLIITERCSLRCKDCANLMQYYPRPANVDLDLLLRSIDALCATVDDIMELRIIGGDAWMNRQWPQVVAHAIDKPQITRVVIYTNGAIVPDPAEAPLLAHAKVSVVATDYGPLSRNMGRLRSYLADNGIVHRILHVDSWLDCARLEKHDRNAAANAEMFQDCCAKNMLSLSDGKLFRCPFAANADRLGAVADNTGDYVDIVGALAAGDAVAEVRHRIMAYVRRQTALTTCDYCNGRPLSGDEVAPAVQANAPLPYVRRATTEHNA